MLKLCRVVVSLETTETHPYVYEVNMTTPETLYRDRCRERDGKLVPHFWRSPGFSDIDGMNPEAMPTMRRLYALGLNLELEVGHFINQAGKRDLPQLPYLKQLLQTNESDEGSHLAAFRQTQHLICPTEVDFKVSLEIKDEITSLADKFHPIAIAAALEVGVFLATLGFMRVVGGKNLSLMAFGIAQDESRHTQINTALAEWAGEPTSQFTSVIERILDFAFGNCRCEAYGIRLDLDFFLSQSRLLVETGLAPDLDALANVSVHQLPFERQNSDLYTRVTQEVY